MTRSIAAMEAQRRQLDREIRAAKRAEVKAAKAALLSERQALGVWLAESVGADSVAAVERLREALTSGQVQGWLTQQIGSGSQDVDKLGAASSGATGNVVGGGHDEVA